jgi:diacylglycerol kinase (ATP)
MRAAAIFGLGCSPHNLEPFQNDDTRQVEWRVGMPAAADQADAVLLFGGDGTIHRHLGQLVKLGVPMLVVPAGSGNDFARALGLRTVRDSLAAWHVYSAGKNNVRSIDLGVITPLDGASAAPSTNTDSASHDPGADSLLVTRYFCSVAGVGLDAEVSRRANHLPRWLRGHGGYALTFAPTMLQFAPFPMRILTPGPTPASTPGGEGTDSYGADSGSSIPWQLKKDQPTLLAAIANTPTYGGGMKIAPHAKMDDGLLDVCVIGGVNPFKLACLFPTVYFGRHLQIREVDYFQADHVRVETEHPLDVYADGEFVCRTPVEVGIRRGAFSVIVPPR